MSDKKLAVKTFVIEVDLKTQKNMRSASARLQEAISLTKAISLEVVGSEIISLREIKSGAYLGLGTIERLREILKEQEKVYIGNFVNGIYQKIQKLFYIIPYKR